MTEARTKAGPIAWMAGNPVAATLLMLTFIVGGLVSLPRIKQEVFPAFELDTITISVPYPGASPSEVEQGVLLAIEDAIRGMDGVKRVTSAANEGVGSVTAELLTGADGPLVLQDIKNEVDRIVTFPEEAEEPVVSLNVIRRAVLSIVLYGDVPEETLRTLAESAKDELTQDPRVTLVEVTGTRPLEISFDVPQEKLRRYGLTLGGMAAEIARATVELGGGGVKTAGGEILLRTNERRDRGREYADIPIVSRPDGSVVRLGELAEIRDAFEDVDKETLYNGQRAVELTVYRIGDEDPISVSRAAGQFVERLRTRLPATVGVDSLNDRSEIYRDRVRLLTRNAGLGLILVMIVLGLFLEVRLAFWVMLGIPISFLGCLLLLPYVGVSINMISLFAFIVAVGIVVDDAIVVGESVYYERQQGKDFFEAAVNGARLVAAPVTFAILTNILAFVPLLFVPGTMGQLWRNIPVVIIAIFAISLVEALFILPSHLAHHTRLRTGRIWKILEMPQQFFGGGLERFSERVYLPFVQRTLRFRYTTVACGAAALILTLGWIRGGRTAFTFFPKVESDRITASAVLPYGVPFDATLRVETRLRETAWEVLGEHGGTNILRGIYAIAGGTPGGFGPMGAVAAGSHLTGVEVNLVPLDQRELTAAEFARLWRERTGRIAGLESLSFKFNIGPASGSPIDIELSHPDEGILEEMAAETAAALARFDGVIEIDDGIERGKPELVFRLKPAARALGLTALDLARQIRHAFYGAEVKRQQRGQDEVKLYVRLPESQRLREDDVEKLILRTPGGGEIPLAEAASVARGRAYEQIRRVEGKRVISVTADVDEKRANANEVIGVLRETVLPGLKADHPNLTYNFEGEQRTQRESIGGLQSGFLVALLALFALLAIPFRSYVQALIIMVAIPFGMIGALLGHILMGYDLSFVSLMGVVALAGVVINDNILLIDTANMYRREGMAVRDAIARAPARRLRPVLLTSMTTFLGLAPMIFETSIQARFMIPMALSLGFGILFSTLITLVLVPSLYLIVEDVKRVRTWLRPETGQPAARR
ncbi:MAG: efflux RND transporter permease subunit [Lentisphaerae bacterium]|nr:efflux RND transporter permease subunit [Lentisphaerota bacterium]